jgi:hypothetical protein
MAALFEAWRSKPLLAATGAASVFTLSGSNSPAVKLYFQGNNAKFRRNKP